jgi:hypothetical protein
MTHRTRLGVSLLGALAATALLAALTAAPAAASDRHTGTVKAEATASGEAGILSDRQTGTVKP